MQCGEARFNSRRLPRLPVHRTQSPATITDGIAISDEWQNRNLLRLTTFSSVGAMSR